MNYLIFLIAIFLGGCNYQSTKDSQQPKALESETLYIGNGRTTEPTIKSVKLEDGTKCVIFTHYNRGGISCDWK